jgi:hypothetical protein
MYLCTTNDRIKYDKIFFIVNDFAMKQISYQSNQLNAGIAQKQQQIFP